MWHQLGPWTVHVGVGHVPLDFGFGTWASTLEPGTMDRGTLDRVLWALTLEPGTMDREPWIADRGPCALGIKAVVVLRARLNL